MGELIVDLMNALLCVDGCIYSLCLSCLLYFSKGALGKCESLLKFVDFMKKLWHEGAMS